MSDEIEKLQAELAAAAALIDRKTVRGKSERTPLPFNPYKREGKLVNETIKEYIDDMSEMRRIKSPFAERIKKAKHVYNYIMANPNIFAAHVVLRENCLTKANEFLNSEFGEYADQAGFAEARAELRSAMQKFIDWTNETLPLNIYYSTTVLLT